LDYGLATRAGAPELMFSFAPQIDLWGATTQLRDTLALLKRRMAQGRPADAADIRAVCLFGGKAARYTEQTFDEVFSSDAAELVASLEVLLVAGALVAVVVHAPVGSISGQAVGLGFASFDEVVVARAQRFVAGSLGRFIQDQTLCRQYLDVLEAVG